MSFEYQSFATLGVNLNRQKYGPLDVSTVFVSEADLTYYRTKGTVIMDGLSDYWEAIVPYPYAGQLIALVVDKKVSIYKLVENNEGLFDIEELGGTVPDGIATETYVQQQIAAIERPNLEDYATKEYVIALIKEFGASGGNAPVEALTQQEVLDILAAASGNVVDIHGSVIDALSKQEILDILAAANGGSVDINGSTIDALSKQEILDILFATSGDSVDIEGSRLIAMTEEEVKNITSIINKLKGEK